jgi:hypothetical protein
MLTNSDGSRIEVADIIDHTGIIGNNDCQYEAAWQAFDCSHTDAYDYRMLSIESMDADTEERRLSPVAVLGERTINLMNGMNDHTNNWGKRLSLFHPTVALNTHFDIYFNGVSPKTLRLHLLNVNSSDSMRVAIFYSNAERLDVYNGDILVHPENAALNSDGHWITQAPPSDDLTFYHPPINSGVHGANYFDRVLKLMYVTLRGPDHIEIRTSPAVVIAFGFPAISVDDFFETNLVSNLATYLGVEPYQIKVVNVVRETSARKRRSTRRSRRSTDVVTYTIQLDTDIASSAATSSNDTQAIVDELNDKASTLLVDYQNNVLWERLNVTDAVSFASTTASAASTAAASGETLIAHYIPSTLQVNTTVTAEEYLAFSSHPVVSMFDSAGNAVTTLGDTL